MIKLLFILACLLLSFMGLIKKQDFIPERFIDQASMIQETLNTIISKDNSDNGSEYEVYEKGKNLVIVVPEGQELEISDDE